jgi:MFS family permease
MVAGALLAAGSGALYGVVESLPALLLLRGVTGVGEAALFVAAATTIADLSPAHRQAEAASYLSVAVFAGLGLGPLLGDAVFARAGTNEAFVVAAVLSVAVPTHVVARGDAPPPVDIDGARGDRRAVDWVSRSSFVHPAALGPGIVLAIAMAAYAAFTAFLPDHARSVGFGGSGALFALYSAVCLVLRVAGARVPERLGARRSVTIALSSFGTGLALLAGVPAAWALWVAAIAIGFGSAFLYPSLMALTVNRASPRDRARAIASFTMFFEVGTASGGLALGALADSFGKRTGFAVAVALCAIGLWVLRTIVVPDRRGQGATVPGLPAFAGPVVGD